MFDSLIRLFARDRELQALQRELDRLGRENRALRSELVEMKETAARLCEESERLTRRCHQIAIDASELKALREENVRCSMSMHRPQAILSAREDSRLRISESHEGVVADVKGDRATVVYNVDGTIVAQTYGRHRFLDGRMPETEDRLIIYVNVVQVELPSHS
jgi:hypothetical protein